LVVATVAVALIATSVAFLFFSRPPLGEGDMGVVLSLDRTELRGDRKLTYTIVNRSQREVTFGEPYDVQVLRGGRWLSVEWMGERVWIMILYKLRPGDSFSRTIDLPADVEPGMYRLVKEVTVVETGEKLVLTAEFVVRQ
jgi:hypothetical protein